MILLRWNAKRCDRFSADRFTLEAFEHTDLFAKVSGYLSEVRVDIGDHVKAGQVLAVISIPEMENELAEDEAQLDSKQRSLETAQRQVEHGKANVVLQDVTLKRQEMLFTSRNIAPQDVDVARANADIAKADVGVAEANIAFAAAQVKLAAATVERVKTLINSRGVRVEDRWRDRVPVPQARDCDRSRAHLITADDKYSARSGTFFAARGDARPPRIAPRVRGVGDAFRADFAPA